MNDNEIIELLERYRKGQTTPKETAAIESWFVQYAHSTHGHFNITDYETIQKQIWERMAIQHKPRHSFRFIGSAAAAAVIFIASLTWMFFSFDKHKQDPIQNISAFDIKPATNKAILTLSNGQQIILNTQNGQLANQLATGTIVSNNASSGIITFSIHDSIKEGSRHLGNTERPINTIQTPRGGQYQLVLSDGTRVYLNAASSITFPSSFAGNNRTVSLVGEAYFKVAKDAKHPFIVNTTNQQLTVLGTHFNLSAYPGEAVKTTLVEGSVSLLQPSTGSRHPLKPDQQALLLSNGFDVRTVSASDEIAWIDGLFIFKNLPIKDAMRQISRWYDVEVDYNSLPNKQLVAEMPRNLTLAQVIEGIAFSGNIKFKLEGRRLVYIK